MGKIYKGYDLFKAIAHNEIKEGSKFKCELGVSNKGFEQEEIYIFEKGRLVSYRNCGTNKMPIYCDYDLYNIVTGKFELLDERNK